MNKIVLITGATSGIGLACARKFAVNGDKLILTGRNEQRLAEIRKELDTEVITLAFDVRNREEAEKQISSLPADWQNIDVLVNNAGLALGLEPEYEGDLDDWGTMIDTNIKGQYQGATHNDASCCSWYGKAESWTYYQCRFGGW